MTCINSLPLTEQVSHFFSDANPGLIVYETTTMQQFNKRMTHIPTNSYNHTQKKLYKNIVEINSIHQEREI